MSESAPRQPAGQDGGGRESAAAGALERRLRSFELRLYHGGLIARAAFPVAALIILAISAALGEVLWSALIVWLALAVWTGATLPYAWSRLEWVRTIPLVVATELVVFLALIYAGFGSRPWHLIHAFVPLALVACFASKWPARAMTAGVIAALWAGWLTVWIWPSAPIDEPLSAPTPSALAIVGYGLVRFARRLMDDLERVIAAQREVAEGLRRARTRAALAEARREVGERVRSHVAALAAGLSRSLPESVAASRDGRALAGLLSQIEVSANELGGVADPSGAGGSVDTVVQEAIEETGFLGREVRFERRGQGTFADLGARAVALRRLVAEALSNARRHGTGDVEVLVEAKPRQRVVVTNPGTGPARGRPGHLGLEAIRADASAIGASAEWRYEGGCVVLEVLIEGALPEEIPPDDATERLLGATDSRRLAYERGMLVARLAMALIATTYLPIKADQHRTILPVLFVTAGLLIAWNTGLLMWWRRIRPIVQERTALVWLDAGAIVLILTFEGGQSTPWIPVSMGSIIFVAYYRQLREGLAIVGLLSLGLLVGYGLMRTLPVDDAGTTVQEMPLAWLINVASYLIVLAISATIRWVFDRTDEAITVFDETAAAERDAVAEEAEVEARAEGRRELHATLLQFVSAARLRVDAAAETAPAGTLDALHGRLESMAAALRSTMAELAQGPEQDAGAPSAPEIAR